MDQESVELRSNGQPRAAVPTFASTIHTTSIHTTSIYTTSAFRRSQPEIHFLRPSQGGEDVGGDDADAEEDAGGGQDEDDAGR